MKRYCIWNNKGGVGKTFLTYLLATEYAKQNPTKEIIVVDMCPQANISEILLGGNEGQGNLEKCFEKGLTIAHYIKDRYQRGKNSLLGNETTYFVNVKQYNNNLPENLFLVPGDSELDICSGLINYLGLSPEKKAWKNSRSLLADLVSSFANASKKEQVYFFDCNPSFSSYTELAIVASNRLIIPCTADNASIRGIKNIFRLVYGTAEAEESEFDQFYENAQKYNIPLPAVHRVVQNKSRSHQKNASMDFQASLQEIENTILNLQSRYRGRFSDDKTEVYNIKDGNTLAAIINYTGKMLDDITIGKHKIYDMEAQVNQDQKELLIEDVKKLISQL